MKLLARLLKINRAWAVGILEVLWHWAGRYAPQGDLGRFSDADISDAVSWAREPMELIEALVESKWVDRHPTYRLVIHDWDKHAEESVCKYLKRNKLPFANVGNFVQTFSGHVQTFSEKVCLPEPVPIPEPEPQPLPPPWDTKKCVCVLDRWFAYLAKVNKPPFDRMQATVALTQMFSSPHDFEEAVNAAIANGWKSVNPSMTSGRKQTKQSGDPTADTITDEDLR